MGAYQPEKTEVMETAIQEILMTHDLGYERIWISFNRTDMWVLQRLAQNSELQVGIYPTSTIYSALKRLQHSGHVIYTNHYEIEDPFFREWLLNKQ